MFKQSVGNNNIKLFFMLVGIIRTKLVKSEHVIFTTIFSYLKINVPLVPYNELLTRRLQNSKKF